MPHRPQTLEALCDLERRNDQFLPIKMPLAKAEARYLDRKQTPKERAEMKAWLAPRGARHADWFRVAACRC